MNIKSFTIDFKLNYQEYYYNAGQINKFYEIENSGANCSISTIPDACLDLRFVKENEKLVIYACGSFLKCDKTPMGKKHWCFGVRFNPGAIPLILRDDVMDLISSRKILDGISWLDELAKKLDAAASFEERIAIFGDEFPFEKQFSKENQIVEYVKKRVREERGCVNIAELADEMKYNQKYMDRVFRKETGLTMKKFATIIRVQTAIRYLQEGRTDDVYERLGYYDQSYFIKEFKKNTSVTPRQFCEENRISIV